jgi:hypothetical protein
MAGVDTFRFKKKGWEVLAPVFLLTFSLAMSVATRFVHYYEPYHSSAKASPYSPQSKRQDLEKDALRWKVPVLASAFFLPPSFAPIVQKPISASRPPLFEENRYNRPPPSC